MTYPNDPNMNRNDITDETSTSTYIIGGVVMLAVILGVFMLVGGGDSNTNTASNANPPATTSRPAPATTGSGATTPAPAPAAPAR
jgi:hypothetical protein